MTRTQRENVLLLALLAGFTLAVLAFVIAETQA